jgi:hypothetical protein
MGPERDRQGRENVSSVAHQENRLARQIERADGAGIGQEPMADFGTASRQTTVRIAWFSGRQPTAAQLATRNLEPVQAGQPDIALPVLPS